MNNLQIFKNKEFGEIRTMAIDDEPWFVGKDVATALGYSNTKDALRSHVTEEDKRIIQRSEITTIENYLPKEVYPVNFVSGEIPNRGLTIINESGLYALIFGSKFESAKRFKRWVTSEVLPSIRKHGGYIIGQENVTDDELLAKALMVAQSIIEERDQIIAQKQKHIEQMRPKAQFAEAISKSSDCIPVGDLAKLLKQNGCNVGQNRLFSWLRVYGYLNKRGREHVPTQRSMEMGLFRIRENVYERDGEKRISKTCLVTPKGQEYFIRKIPENMNRKHE